MTHMTGTVLVAAAMLAAGWEVGAHHSNVAVDMTRRASVKGIVKTLEWTNPHVWLWIVSDDGNGDSRTFAFETSSPSELTRFFGWNRRMLAAGDRVTVEYAPFKNGQPGGWLVNLTLVDGEPCRRRCPTGSPDKEPL